MFGFCSTLVSYLGQDSKYLLSNLLCWHIYFLRFDLLPSVRLDSFSGDRYHLNRFTPQHSGRSKIAALGIWESVLPRPKVSGLHRSLPCFSSPGRDRLSGGALVPLGAVGVWQQLGAAAEDLRAQFPTLLSRRPFCVEAWKRNVSQGSCRAGHPGSVTWVKSGAVSLSLGPS